MDAPAKKKRRQKPINGLSLEIMDAMVREYGEWQTRVQTADPTMPAALSDDEKWMLESHRTPVATVHKLRRAIFEDLVRRGFNQSEVCQRLLISRKTHSRLAIDIFGVNDPMLIRALCNARNLARQDAVTDEIKRMVKMRDDRPFKDRVFTTAERDAYFKLIKLGDDLDESYRKLNAADAPERKEIVETKQYAVVLLPVESSQEPRRTVIDISQNVPPLLIDSTAEDISSGDQ